MKKVKAYLSNVLDGLGIFLNTLVGGDLPESIFDRIREMLLDAKDSIKDLFNK